MIPTVDLMAAIRWWFALTLLGIVVWPLCFSLLRRLPDRGYSFTKMAGLLGAGYFFWLANSLGLAQNDGGGILLAITIVLILSIWAYRSARPSDDIALLPWVRSNLSTIITVEVVFIAVFALWVIIRAQNPAITATEKPMEIAFLNAVGRSPSFPPLDPWLSDYAISYYYFGYVMTSLVARLAAVSEQVAFNLALAWLVAGTAVGAFGLTFNLIAARDRRRSAFILGLVAALALPIAGNQIMSLELLKASNVAPESLLAWADVSDLNRPPDLSQPPRYESSSWWWWRSSRPIHEYHLSGRPESGLEPIVEVPSFSFILGDLHPHVLALPFAFLSLGMALAWWLGGLRGDGAMSRSEWEAVAWTRRPLALVSGLGLPLWLASTVILGGLSFLNTWDVLIHLFVFLGAFLLAGWYRHGWGTHLLTQAIWLGIITAAMAFLLYLPFYLGFRSQAAPPFLLPMLMRPTRLVQFLIIFGMPLFAVGVFLFALAYRQRFRYWKKGVALALGLLVVLFILTLFLVWLMASTAADSGRIMNLASELNIVLAPRPERSLAPIWGFTTMLRLLPAIIMARIVYAGLTAVLVALVALVIMVLIEKSTTAPTGKINHDQSTLPFVLLLIFTGILLTLGPEFVYLRDNFGVRLNTIFKFYYQAWVLFGIGALFAIDYLWAEWRSGVERIVPVAVTLGYAAMLIIGLIFPYYAVRSRAIEYRGPTLSADGDPLDRHPPTLDGLAYLQRSNPDEYEALMWLRDQSKQAGLETPVVLEAVGGQYSGFARVSANTGLPTLLGWAGHQLQWRGSSNSEPGIREPIIREIYTTRNLEAVSGHLDNYGVDLIYVGELEETTYGGAGLEKFRDNLDVAFTNDRVTIFRWQPDGRSS